MEVRGALSNRLGNEVYLKREDQQPIFSFKIRGAYNKIRSLSQEEKDKGVICVSAGNHGQGIALSAKKLGIKAKVVMPLTTPQIKVNEQRNALTFPLYNMIFTCNFRNQVLFFIVIILSRIK